MFFKLFHILRIMYIHSITQLLLTSAGVQNCAPGRLFYLLYNLIISFEQMCFIKLITLFSLNNSFHWFNWNEFVLYFFRQIFFSFLCSNPIMFLLNMVVHYNCGLESIFTISIVNLNALFLNEIG